MKIPEIWYFVCWVFGFYSLNTLIEESHEVVYEKSNEVEDVQHLACKELSYLNSNKTKINLKEMRNDLWRHFNSSIDLKKDPNSGKLKELILNRTKTGGYLILNRKICLFANNESELEHINWLLSLTIKLAFKRDTADLVEIKEYKDKIDQLVVLKKPFPYSDCEKSNSRFFCLNNCFKRRARLARYFYHSNETGTIQLNFSERNEVIRENEKTCFEECWKANCKMIQLIAVDQQKKLNFEKFEAQPKLSEFDYWLQFIGLFCSFAGLSLHELTTIAIEFALWKVKKRRRKVRMGLFYLKLATLFLGLASFSYLSTQKILKYKEEKNNPSERKTRHLIQPKIVQLAICVNIDFYEKGERCERRTMLEIERATDGALVDHLEGIYVNYQDRSFRTDYQVQPKVLFKKSLQDYHSSYFRCFILAVQPNYQIIPRNPKLTIKFKSYVDGQVYLLNEDENLNGKSFEYTGVFAFQKRIVKRLRNSGRCVDYKEKYAGNCTGRWNCVERCIQRNYMEKFNQITFGILYSYKVVDKNWFSPTQWNTTHPTKFENDVIYENITKDCFKETPDERPCDEVNFEQTVEINQPDPQTLEIDLQIDVERSVEESPSTYKLALDLLSIQDIFFGFTVFGILQMICSLIQRQNKIVWFLIYLLCSIGASWHTYHIFHLIISGELVPTQYYELKDQIEMPEMVFCYQINQNLIDRNKKLTGDYLEELTSELTTVRMFRNISYLNESNEWIPFDRDLAEGFFFLDMKCFGIKINQTYERDQFHFTTERQVLKANFTDLLNEEVEFVYFMTKSKETEEFGKFIKLDYSWEFVRSLYRRYSITHEISIYEYEDRFSFIRRHFLSPQEDQSDLNGQLSELQSNDHNLKSLNIPVQEKDFKFELNEHLFGQLYSVEKQKNRNKPINLNYQQMFVSNYLRKSNSFKSDLSFNLIFLQKIVYSTNEENLGKLILSLLNVLSIWFDLGVLDLHPFFPLLHDLLVHLYLHLPVFLNAKAIQFLLFACKWLRKIKPPLYELLKPRK